MMDESYLSGFVNIRQRAHDITISESRELSDREMSHWYNLDYSSPSRKQPEVILNLKPRDSVHKNH